MPAIMKGMHTVRDTESHKVNWPNGGESLLPAEHAFYKEMKRIDADLGRLRVSTSHQVRGQGQSPLVKKLEQDIVAMKAAIKTTKDGAITHILNATHA